MAQHRHTATIGSAYTPENSPPINFYASINRVATLVDGGIRITLDLPENAVGVAAQFMECKRQGAVVDFSGNVRFEDESEYGGRLKDG